MATITLEYNSHNIEAQRTLDNILSAGLFKKRTFFKRKSGIERALEDVRKGRVYTYNSVDDLLKKINS